MQHQLKLLNKLHELFITLCTNVTLIMNPFTSIKDTNFDGKPKLHYDCILKLEKKIATVTKLNPKELALGKEWCNVIKFLKSLPQDIS